MDEADIANDLAEKYLIGSISAARAGIMGEPAIARGECLDCGEEIPEARRKAVHPLPCERCMACQESAERAG